MIKKKKGTLGGKAVVAAGILGAAAGAVAVMASDKNTREKAVKMMKDAQAKGEDLLKDSNKKVEVSKKDAEKALKDGKNKAKSEAQKKIKAL